MAPKNQKNSSKKAERVIARENQLAKLEEKLLRGITNQFQLAASFGVAQTTISGWIQEIKRRWKEGAQENTEELKQTRIKQIESLAVMSLNSYDRSRRDVEEYTTTKKGCEDCGASGKRKKKCGLCTKGKEEFSPGKYRVCLNCVGEGFTEEDCVTCNATGEIVVETKRVKGQAGDASFLTVARLCFEACAKIEGVMAPEKSNAKFMKEIVTESRKVGGDIQRTVEQMWCEAPIDLIIRSRSIIEEFKAGVANKEVKVIETTVVGEVEDDLTPYRENEASDEDETPKNDPPDEPTEA